MDDAARRIMEMKVEEAIAWHDRKGIEIAAQWGREMAPGEPGDTARSNADQELYRMIRVATGIDD